jgi:hypothetical protein
MLMGNNYVTQATAPAVLQDDEHWTGFVMPASYFELTDNVLLLWYIFQCGRPNGADSPRPHASTWADVLPLRMDIINGWSLIV